MTSNRPYLIRALYDWILDNQMTPHLLVSATHPRAKVPEHFVQDGKIVLNISPSAVRTLLLGNDLIELDARFGGVAMHVEVPVDAVLGIYARENGHGMLFPDEMQEKDSMEGSDEGLAKPEPQRERPTLKVIK